MLDPEVRISMGICSVFMLVAAIPAALLAEYVNIAMGIAYALCVAIPYGNSCASKHLRMEA